MGRQVLGAGCLYVCLSVCLSVCMSARTKHGRHCRSHDTTPAPLPLPAYRRTLWQLERVRAS
eukprot:SAG22_NODE_1043_length_5882_cov_148.833132_9_plen_62_part_00